MRPLRLQVEGFTSFRERQEVDLTDLDLFVITGPTGSGKSSLLDAMVLALYGQVPRANKSELRDLVTHGVAEARIRLDFTVEGREYVATRRLPRSGGSQQATIERLDPDGEPVPEVEASGVRAVNDRIEEIVGLDYDTFIRAVLLPQGEFAEFLRGDRQKRRDILIRLLDLSRYEAVGEVARSRAREKRTRLETLQERLEAEFGDIDESGLEERRGELEAARRQRQEVEELAGGARGELEAALEAAGRGRDLEALRERLGQDRRRLQELADRWRRLAPRDRATARELQEAEERLREATAAKERAAAGVQEAVSATGDEAALERLRSARDRRREAREELRALEEKVGTAEARLEELSEGLQEAAEEVAERRRALEAAEAAEAEARERLGEAERALARARRRADAEAELEEARGAVEGGEREERSAREELREAREAAEAAEARERHLRREHAAAALREGLEPGDDCPVCGRPIEELPQEGTEPEEEIREAEAARAAARERASRAEAAVARRGERLEVARRRLGEAESALEELDEAPEPEVAAARVEERRESLEELGGAGGRAAEATREAEKRRQRIEVERGEVRSALEAARESRETWTGRLQEAVATLEEVYPDGLPEDLDADVERRAGRLQEAREAERAAAAAVEEARERRDAAGESREEHRRMEARIDAELAEVRAGLAERRGALQEHVDDELPALPERDEEGERGAWTETAREWSEALDVAAGQARETSRQRAAELRRGVADALAERGVDVDAEATVDELRGALERLVADARRAEVRAEERVGEMERALERRGALVGEVEELEARAARLGKLGVWLRKDRFIDFVLEESLAHLAASASSELGRISEERYSLGAEGHGFVVVDHANADERRSVATLSGGETFLASLALALALAQGLTDIAGKAVAARLEAIFIDEGFGNLDPATLETVVDALERLRETERMVGVITHVPTLADRIPAGLEVEVHSRGSRVQRR